MADLLSKARAGRAQALKARAGKECPVEATAATDGPIFFKSYRTQEAPVFLSRRRRNLPPVSDATRKSEEAYIMLAMAQRSPGTQLH